MQKKLYLCFISVYSEINKGKKSCLHNNNNNNNNKIKNNDNSNVNDDDDDNDDNDDDDDKSNHNDIFSSCNERGTKKNILRPHEE